MYEGAVIVQYTQYITFSCLFLLSLNKSLAGSPCIPKHLGGESIVCVCNSTYCDTVEPVGQLKTGQFVIYSTTKSGQRFARSVSTFSSAVNTTGIFS